MKYMVKNCRSFPSAFTPNGICYYTKSIIDTNTYDRYIWYHSEKCYKVSCLGHTLKTMGKFDFATLMNAHYNFCMRKPITIPIR